MADAKMLKKVPVREQDPKVRATNFEEVCLGYNQEEAMEEAQRCLRLQETEMCRRMSGIHQYSWIYRTDQRRKHRRSIQSDRIIFRTSGYLRTCMSSGVPV